MLKDNLIPTPLEAFFYLILTLVVALLASIRYFTNYLLLGTPTTFDGVKQQLEEGFGDLLSFVDSLSFTPDIAVLVFWGFVGLILFSLGQSIFNTFTQFKEDVEISTSFVHPRNFMTSQFWLDVILMTAAHTSIAVIAILWSFVMASVLVPVSAIGVNAVLNNPSAQTLGALAASVVMLYAGVLVEAILLKLLLKHKQLAV